MVEPSSPLIEILHQRLHDPSIVPAFEHSRNDLDGLLRPHWQLIPANESTGGGAGEGVAAQNVSKAANIGSNIQGGINAVPKRHYLDLRIEQNRLFADDQLVHCREALRSIQTCHSSSNPSSSARTPQNQSQQLLQLPRQPQIKKLLNVAKSSIEEGLAACPDHKGLLNARLDFMKLVGRPAEKEAPPALQAAPLSEAKLTSSLISRPDAESKARTQTLGSDAINNCLPDADKRSRKGAEQRAQAALRDALAERSFAENNANNSLLANHYGSAFNEHNSRQVESGKDLVSSDVKIKTIRSSRTKRRGRKERKGRSRSRRHDVGAEDDESSTTTDNESLSTVDSLRSYDRSDSSDDRYFRKKYRKKHSKHDKKSHRKDWRRSRKDHHRKSRKQKRLNDDFVVIDGHTGDNSHDKNHDAKETNEPIDRDEKNDIVANANSNAGIEENHKHSRKIGANKQNHNINPSAHGIKHRSRHKTDRKRKRHERRKKRTRRHSSSPRSSSFSSDEND